MKYFNHLQASCTIQIVWASLLTSMQRSMLIVLQSKGSDEPIHFLQFQLEISQTFCQNERQENA